ncbi:phosphoribosylformylglycinamidine synthase subunit PurL, partial [Candidatus Sumerlaeota bacterium]|nr:phosphoribosylformylglycinamidine synthase subunit PurL [Candidatus Sumerlaeota bacterium]
MTTKLHEPEVTPALAKEHGLTEQEYARLVKALGRTPSFTELGIVSVMWSEHCSYKSSRLQLKTLPTEGPAVVQGPGENAGAVSIGDGEAIVFKIESHNHPSAVEPYQGATTGVGGILRDIFTMGARPIAMLNSLRFGDARNPKVKQLADGVVRGIADYGNCVGVPTVAGEVYFDKCYEGNPLVNAMCVGRIKTAKLTKAAAKTVGGLVIYFGNPTGRDGVHGATFASEELTEETMAQRSAVQVGDPFMGKKILEATLDLIEAGVIEAIQDMGAAGLTCSSCEMGSRGGLGVRIDLDKVPRRAEGLTPYEIMLSESQERMLAVCHPRDLEKVKKVLAKWDLEAYVIGEVTGTGNLEVFFEGEKVAELSNDFLAKEAPVYDLPRSRPDYLDKIPQYHPKALSAAQLKEAALALLGNPNIASKRWIFEQYDTQVQTQTVQKPGGSAAVLRIKDYDSPAGNGRKPEKQIATTVDCNGLFCYLDPREGAKLAVAEAARNLVCAGAQPLGVTNCLNFGNPNKPGVFWQFCEVIAGMGEACRAFGTPVTGGNVSLYNENPEGAVFPTPVIGMIGLVKDPSRRVSPFFSQAGLELWLLGPDPATLGGSQFAQIGASQPVGPCPPINLQVELEVQHFILNLIGEGKVLSV